MDNITCCSMLLCILIRWSLATIAVHNSKNQTVDLIDDYSSRFGPELPNVGLKGYVMIANPKNGCLPIERPPNISYVNNWIALIQRSPMYTLNCSFDLKVYNAQKAGYAAVIIYNIDSDSLIRMSSSGKYDIKIPSVFIGESDGIELGYFYTYLNKSYVTLTDDDFSISIYLVPFAVIVGACFIIMITVFAVKFAIYYHKTRKNRLSRSALKRLPVKKYQKSDKYDTCPICLEEYEEGVKLRILPCEHAYHVKCIDEWLLKNNRSCPVCKRRVLPGDDSDDDSLNEDIGQQQSSQAQDRNTIDRNLVDVSDSSVEHDDDMDERTRLIDNPSTSTGNQMPITTTIITLIPNNLNQYDQSNMESENSPSQYGSILSTPTPNEPAASKYGNHNRSTSSQNSLLKRSLNSNRRSNTMNDDNESQLLYSADEEIDDDELLDEVYDNADQAALLPVVRVPVANNSRYSNKKQSKNEDFLQLTEFFKHY